MTMVWCRTQSFIRVSSVIQELLPFVCLNIKVLCFQSHNILMDEHDEYLLKMWMYGGVFEVLSECY